MTDEFDQDVEDRELAREEGDVAFSLFFDSEAPGCSDAAEVLFHNGRYWAFADFDLADPGPFDSLEQALRDSGLDELHSGAQIECDELSAPQLLACLRVYGESGGGPFLVINEQVWRRVGQTWHEADPEDEEAEDESG